MRYIHQNELELLEKLIFTGFKENQKAPVCMVNMDYNKIKLNAFDDHLLEFRDNQLYEVQNPPEPPYETNRLFTVYIPGFGVENSYANAGINNNTVVFSLDTSLYISNTTDIIQKIDIDFGRGKKYWNLRFGSEISVKYSDIGSEAIVTLHRKNGEDLSCKCGIVKSEISDSELMESATIAMDESSESPINDSIPIIGSYGGKDFGAFLGYCFGCQTTSISDVKKPVIILEGWDPTNFKFLDEIYNETNAYDLIPNLQNQGYDVILMNYGDGGADIRGNAMALREFINYLNETLDNNDSYNKIVVIGESMGGLVARYALRYMESVGEDHNTRLFMTMDTPHRGAYFPYSIQHIGASALELVNKIRVFWITIEALNLINNPALTLLLNQIRMQLEKEIEDVQKLFTCKSSKQMLVYYEPASRDPSHPTLSPERTQLLNDFDNLGNNGYPASVDKMVALSFGSGANSPQEKWDAGDTLYFYDDPLNIEINKETHESLKLLDSLRISIFTLPYQTRKNIVRVYGEKKFIIPPIPGWILYGLLHDWRITVKIDLFDLTVEGTLPYEHAPGGFLNIATEDIVRALDGALKTKWIDSLGNICFVPTVSSLDLKNKPLDYNIYSNLTDDESYYEINNHSITMFDAIYVEGENKEHGNAGATEDMINKVIELIVGDENLLLKDLFITDEKAQYEAVNSITLDNVHISSSNTAMDNAALHLKAGETVIFEKDFSIGKNCTFEVVNQGVCE
ncbi:MAG: putative lipase [Prolixibacteraceae bacterium]|nr:putative lipase [Prolixibacteraceae bacterium]